MRKLEQQTIRVISNKPQYIKSLDGKDFAILGIIKDSFDYYCVLYWIRERNLFTMNNIFIEILDWSKSHNIEDANFIQIDNDDEFAYIYQQIKNYTNFLNEKYIQQIDQNFRTYLKRKSYLRPDLKPIENLEKYVIDKAIMDIEKTFTEGAYFPPQRELKFIIDYLRDKTLLLASDREAYWKHYIALYIEEYKKNYNMLLLKQIQNNIDKAQISSPII